MEAAGRMLIDARLFEKNSIQKRRTDSKGYTRLTAAIERVIETGIASFGMNLDVLAGWHQRSEV